MHPNTFCKMDTWPNLSSERDLSHLTIERCRAFSYLHILYYVALNSSMDLIFVVFCLFSGDYSIVSVLLFKCQLELHAKAKELMEIFVHVISFVFCYRYEKIPVIFFA